MAASADGYTLTYTVGPDDRSYRNGAIDFLVTAVNDDAFKGLDDYYDAMVRVSYQLADMQPTPNVNGFKVNGKTYGNALPAVGMHLITDAVAAGSAVTIEPVIDEGTSASFSWFDGGQLVTSTGTAAIQASAQAGVYTIHVTAVVSNAPGSNTVSDIYVPVGTTDKPAQLGGLLVNGADPTGRVFKVGDQLTVKALGTDPLGKPIEYTFNVLGGTVTAYDWSEVDTIDYVVTQADVTAGFAIRVWVRNNDGRSVIDGYDAATTFPITTSE